MNLLLLTSHAIAEYDDLRMFTDLGYDVFSIGGAYDEVPFEGKRPALDVQRFPDFVELCHRQREKYGEPGPAIDWAKARLHPAIIDWADVIIVHHFPERWIGDQWDAIRHKRVIWRTCGQSDPRLETVMAPFRKDGMQIVRYSPAERRAFQRMGMWAGEDALIRFGKYPDDYAPWIGDNLAIGNITQDMARRGEATGLERWERLTSGMPTMPAGPGSKELRGGVGPLSYDGMVEYLRRIRCYLYLGTQPASYTLGLIEAMMAGVPIVTKEWNVPGLDWAWLAHLWEGSEIVGDEKAFDPRLNLKVWLENRDQAAVESVRMRTRAINLFGIKDIGRQWVEFLDGIPPTLTYEKATAA